ncbi:MAG: MOSC domain-containing protein [Pseudobacteriovorax sp.]|nr:MOSC domain-containing protein [Pseudobacteriovorax sp.]
MQISGLAFYPVKSGAAISTEQAVVYDHGLAGDRSLMLIDDTGTFVSQRKLPEMAKLFVRRLDEETYELIWEGASIIWSLNFEDSKKVKVWKDELLAYDQGDDVAEVVSLAFGKSLRVVAIGPESRRPVNPKRTDGEVLHHFADGYPYLFASMTSLADLNDKIPGDESVPMNRFRPNIIVEGLSKPFMEDEIKRVRIGSAVFRFVSPCARCTVTTTDQSNGKVYKEPLVTLGKYRYLASEKGICFGMNAILEEGSGTTIQIGDALDILD